MKTPYIPIQVNLFSLVYRNEINQFNTRQGLGGREVKGGGGLGGLASLFIYFFWGVGGKDRHCKVGRSFFCLSNNLNYIKLYV